MSRQKKVLAIVGDGVLANSQIAVDAVPALKNFYDLCHEKGGDPMSAKPTDHRPKVKSSFRAALDGLNIGGQTKCSMAMSRLQHLYSAKEKERPQVCLKKLS